MKEVIEIEKKLYLGGADNVFPCQHLLTLVCPNVSPSVAQKCRLGSVQSLKQSRAKAITERYSSSQNEIF